MRSDVDAIVLPVGAHPILHILAAFPLACFTCALATDLVYWNTGEMMWADFSAWLLGVGFAVGLLAAFAGIIDVAVRRRRRDVRPGWEVVVGSLVALVIAAFDNMVHSRDAWTSVVPSGLALSAALVVVTLATAWFGFGGGRRRVVVVRPAPAVVGARA